MNVKKTKTMVVCRDETPNVKIVINGQVKIAQVKKFKYLGQWVTDDGRCECEIKNRIEIARSTFIKMRDVLRKGLCTFHLFVCLRIMDTRYADRG